jgi:hypothetical protein
MGVEKYNLFIMSQKYSACQTVSGVTVLMPFLMTFLISLAPFLVCAAGAEAPAPSAYRLVGTVGSSSFSGAVLIDEKGVQTFFRLHEKLPDGSEIVKVRDDNISLKGADGALYDMYMLHETRAGTSAQSRLSVDPYAGVTTRKPPGEQQLRPYERRRQKRLGKTGRDEDNDE